MQPNQGPKTPTAISPVPLEDDAQELDQIRMLTESEPLNREMLIDRLLAYFDRLLNPSHGIA